MARDLTREAMTQAGLNLIQQALSIYDSDLRLAVSNRMFREMFDLPPHLATPGASFAETIRFLVERGEYGEVGDKEGFVQARIAAALAFEPHYMERRRANGRVISVEGSPLPQGGWVTVYTDITQIKEQERLLRARSVDLAEKVLEHAERTAAANRRLAAANAQLEEAKREITETEARTRLTAEMVPAHISRVGRDRVYTFSNRRLAHVLPGCSAAPEGQRIEEVLGENRFARIARPLARAEAGEPCVHEFQDDATGRRIRVAFTPDVDGGGAVTGVYLLSMDVTEEAQARAALAQTHKRELAAQLTSGLAHDFANLLTIILGAQSRLARQALPAEADELVAATVAAARRGGLLLDRLAQISGPRALRPVATDLPALLDDIVTLAAPSLPEAVQLRAGAEGLGEPLLLDAGALQDSLINLVLNARDALGETGQVEIEARREGDAWVVLSVHDSGPGFSDEALSRAVDPFFTTKGGEGSGLGLSMVYDQVKLAGGHLRLGRSDRLGGARVDLMLPLRLVPAGGGAARHFVLLVDDSAEIRAGVREMLVELGHQVVEAGCIDEALALAPIDGLNLVLSDLSLAGGETGLALADALAAQGHGLPFLLMSSRPPGDALRDRAAGRFPLLAKPFSAGELEAFLALPPQVEAAE